MSHKITVTFTADADPKVIKKVVDALSEFSPVTFTGLEEGKTYTVSA